MAIVACDDINLSNIFLSQSTVCTSFEIDSLIYFISYGTVFNKIIDKSGFPVRRPHQYSSNKFNFMHNKTASHLLSNHWMSR